MHDIPECGHIVKYTASCYKTLEKKMTESQTILPMTPTRVQKIRESTIFQTNKYKHVTESIYYMDKNWI